MFKVTNIFLLLLFTASANSVCAQSTSVKQMQKLSHFVGNWEGTSKQYENDILVNEVPAYEKISYKVDKHILTIDLDSETLKIHTVIYYDEKAETYYYNPYYENGTARYPAKLVDKKLIVSPSTTKRFIFEITDKGKFREYGENYKDGKWTTYFEDVFQKQ